MPGNNSCQSCGGVISTRDRFCPSCGADVARTASSWTESISPVTGDHSTCPSCGSPLAESNNFCSHCGGSRSDDVTVPSQGSLERITAERLASATAGEFDILERIGYGAMGSVYLARDVALSRRVAIKVIAQHLLEDETVVARFRLEAQTVAALRHPSIVNLYGVRESGDLHYFIMDFIDGPSLRSLMKAHVPLDIPVVQALLFQIGGALHYAHRRGIGVIHRDIKPANIMVDREGHAVVMDFGISRVGEGRSGLTQTGATIGTPEYMSPEQCMDEELTGASDQYALGIVAYEMLTGCVPFTGSTYLIMASHASSPPPPITERRPDCPPQLEAAVMRMLAKSTAERFSDMEAAVAGLGGRPLGPSDPIRSAIVELAESISSDLVGLDDSSPLSPVLGTTEQATITMVGLPDIVEPGDEFDLRVESRKRSGTALRPSDVAWFTSDPSVASVEDGLVHARAPGSVSLTATVGAIASTVILSVRERRSAAVSVRPQTVLINVGGSIQLQADVVDRNGDPLRTPLVWSTVDAGIALVAQDGTVTAVASGTTRITVDADGVKANAEIEVQAAVHGTDGPGVIHVGDELASVARTSAAKSVPTRARRPTPTRRKRSRAPWIGLAALVVIGLGLMQVLGGGGLQEVLGGGGDTPSGSATSTPPGTDGSAAGDSRLTDPAVDDLPPAVDDQPPAVDETIASVRIEGGDRVLQAGTSQTLSVTGLNASGDRMDAPSAQWRSSNRQVATVIDGRVEATSVGRTTIAVTVAGVRGFINVTVEAAALEPPSREEVRQLVQAFANRLRTADNAALSRIFGRGRATRGGDDLVSRMRASNFTARVARMGVPALTQNGATVDFELEVALRDARGTQNRRSVQLRGVMEPSSSGWRLANVTRRSGG